MAWDPAEPQDTTKIRNLGVVIRPNWVAIKDADSTFQPAAINFTDRTVAAYPNNPTAISDAYILYSKTDSAGNSELFGINETSGITQFTRGTSTVAGNGQAFLPGGVFIKWGQTSWSGTNTTKNVVYTDFGLTAFPTDTLAAFVTILGSVDTPFDVINYANTGFQVRRDSGGTNNLNFKWFAIGY